MRHRKNSNSVIATPRQLDKLIEEATVDCYNGEEQASGFFAMIEENLTLPFRTCILGIEVSVVAAEMDNDGGLKAVCERAGKQQRFDLNDLPLPSPPPSGAQGLQPIAAGGTTADGATTANKANIRKFSFNAVTRLRFALHLPELLT